MFYSSVLDFYCLFQVCVCRSEWLRQGVLKGTWSPVVSCDFDCGLQVAIGNSIVLCNLVFADRNGMAASRFLAAVGACVILLCFPAEGRKSHCTGSMKVVMAADFFLILVLIIVDFGTNSLLKKIVPTRSTEHNHIKDCLW